MLTIWIDVEDLFQYARYCRRPSGIQRVAFALQRALYEGFAESVRFLRHGGGRGGFVEIPFSDVEALFEELLNGPAAPAGQGVAGGVAGRVSWGRRWRRRMFAALAPAAREPVGRLWRSLLACRRAIYDIAALMVAWRPAGWRRNGGLPGRRGAWGGAEGGEGDCAGYEAGGWFVMLGAPCMFADYHERMAAFCGARGLRTAVLVFDILALRRPEWFDGETTREFSGWFHAAVRDAGAVFAISQTTARDVEHYERETGFGLKGQVHALPLGTGFGGVTTALRTGRLPAAGGYVLMVATIEARKNHQLLFRVWRELLETMPVEQVPMLVLAGRVGWLVQDLMVQLKNTGWLGGKILLIEDPSDSELAALYEGCRFTLYPSLAEGWGLPITESLMHGVPCLTSNRGAMREAGGGLAFYCDPDDLGDAVRAVRRLIDEPAVLARARVRITASFRRVAWSETAAALVRVLAAREGDGVVRAMGGEERLEAAAEAVEQAALT